MRSTAYQVLRHRPRPVYSPQDIPLTVTFLRFEPGLHHYYRALIPGMMLRGYGLCDSIMVDEASTEERVQDANVIVISRPNSPNEVEAIRGLQAAGKIVVLDTDDYVHLTYTLGETLKNIWTEERIDCFEQCVRLADLVTVSVQPIADRMLEIGAKKVVCLDNALDPLSGRWDVPWPKDDGKVRIGWIAGFTHSSDAEVIERPIKRVLAKYPNVVFVSVGYMAPWVADLSPDQFEVRRTGGVMDLPSITVGLDICLGPLAYNNFNNYRSAVKFYEATCAGSCFVASDYGPYKSLTRNIAYLCDTEDEWTEAIGRLVNSQSVRARLWHRALESLWEHGIDNQVISFYRAYRDAVASSEVYKVSKEIQDRLRSRQTLLRMPGEPLRAKSGR